MKQSTRVALAAGAFASLGLMGCSSATSSPSSSGSGPLPTATTGWATIISSAGNIILPSAYSGGLTDGATAGPSSLFFLDSQHAFTAGHLGEILMTPDGGESSVGVGSPTSGDLYAIAALSPTEIWVAGKDVSGASVWKSTTGGATWTKEVNTAAFFGGMAYLDRVQGFVITPSRQVAAVGGLTNNSAFVLGRDSLGPGTHSSQPVRRTAFMELMPYRPIQTT